MNWSLQLCPWSYLVEHWRGSGSFIHLNVRKWDIYWFWGRIDPWTHCFFFLTIEFPRWTLVRVSIYVRIELMSRERNICPLWRMTYFTINCFLNNSFEPECIREGAHTQNTQCIIRCRQRRCQTHDGKPILAYSRIT